MQTRTGSPTGAVSAIEGVTLVAVIATAILTRYRIRLVRE